MELIKVGGSCLTQAPARVARRIADLASRQCLVVHGYSTHLRRLLATHHIERPRFTTASGKSSRFTPPGVLAAAHLAAFLAQQALRAGLQTHFHDVRAIMGYEGCLAGRRKDKIRYKQNGVLRIYRGDFSGRVEKVHRSGLHLKSGACTALILTPLLADGNGGILVCDADHAAAELAVALGLDHYTILSDTDGFKVRDQVIARMGRSRIPAYLSHASGGMVKKVHYIARALQAGVGRVHLLNGLSSQPQATQGTLFHDDTHPAHS